MKLETVHIFDFVGENKYRPADYPPKENGYYMTIRCGFGGIYTHLDEWKDGQWMVGIADASIVIAYTKKQIPKEIVDEWCKEKISKYKKTLKV